MYSFIIIHTLPQILNLGQSQVNLRASRTYPNELYKITNRFYFLTSVLLTWKFLQFGFFFLFLLILSVSRPIFSLHLLESIQADMETFLESKGYRLIEKMAEGVQGSIYRVVDMETAVDRVLKAMIKEDQLKAIESEKIALRRLKYVEGVVVLVDEFEDDEMYYLILELLSGCDLFDYLSENGCFDQIKTILILNDLLEILIEVHKKGVFHRDIKAENIIYDEKTNKICLIDFGAAFIETPETKKQLRRTICGTLNYISPEVALCIPYKPRDIDVWCVGVMMYLCICGTVPFKSDSLEEIRQAMTEFKVSFEKPQWKQVPKSLRKLIRWMLEKDACHRPSPENALRYLNDVVLDELNINEGYLSPSLLRRNDSKLDQDIRKDSSLKSRPSKDRRPSDIQGVNPREVSDDTNEKAQFNLITNNSFTWKPQNFPDKEGEESELSYEVPQRSSHRRKNTNSLTGSQYALNPASSNTSHITKKISAHAASNLTKSSSRDDTPEVKPTLTSEKKKTVFLKSRSRQNLWESAHPLFESEKTEEKTFVLQKSLSKRNLVSAPEFKLEGMRSPNKRDSTDNLSVYFKSSGLCTNLHEGSDVGGTRQVMKESLSRRSLLTTPDIKSPGTISPGKRKSSTNISTFFKRSSSRINTQEPGDLGSGLITTPDNKSPGTMSSGKCKSSTNMSFFKRSSSRTNVQETGEPGRGSGPRLIPKSSSKRNLHGIPNLKTQISQSQGQRGMENADTTADVLKTCDSGEGWLESLDESSNKGLSMSSIVIALKKTTSRASLLDFKRSNSRRNSIEVMDETFPKSNSRTNLLDFKRSNSRRNCLEKTDDKTARRIQKRSENAMNSLNDEIQEPTSPRSKLGVSKFNAFRKATSGSQDKTPESAEGSHAKRSLSSENFSNIQTKLSVSTPLTPQSISGTRDFEKARDKNGQKFSLPQSLDLAKSSSDKTTIISKLRGLLSRHDKSSDG